jgi:hypothetical protein
MAQLTRATYRQQPLGTKVHEFRGPPYDARATG